MKDTDYVEGEGAATSVASSDPTGAEPRKELCMRLDHGKPGDAGVIVVINDMEVRGIRASVITRAGSRIVNSPASHLNHMGTPKGHPPINCFLGVPLKQHDEVTGIIALANKPGGYTSRDLRAIEALAVPFVEALHRKRNNIELERHREHLEELVEEQTVELTVESAARKSLEEELYLKNIVFEASAAANIIADNDGILTHVNPACLEAWGFESKDEVVGKPLSSLFYEEMKAAQVLEALNETGRWDGDFVAKRTDGARLVSRALAAAVIRKCGEPIGYQFACVDVTSRRLAEAAIIESEQRLRDIINSMVDAVVMTDCDGMITQFNTAFAISLDRGTEVLGRHLTCLVTEAEMPKLELNISRTLEQGRASNFECGGQTMKGDEIPLLISATLIRGSDDKPHSMIFVIKDITELKAAQSRLLEEKAFSDKLIDNMPGVFYLFDDTGRFVRWNRNFERATGRSAEELSQARPIDLFEGEDAWTGSETIKHVFAKGHSSVEADLRSKAGTKTPYYFAGLLMSVGDKPHLAGVGVDISERRIITAALKEHSAKLKISNDELERFAYVVSHDLQEPLRKIRAFGDRLSSRCAGQLDKTGLDCLDRMSNAAARMQRMISDLLSLSRVKTKAAPFVPVNLVDIAVQVRSDLETRAIESGGRVDIGELPTIVADPTQMYQLLQNLIGNALKFRRPGETPLVTISGRLIDGCDCEIIVKDNGIGFEEEHAERIFEVFHRLHGIADYDGTGIGLAICRKIADRHGGRIQAQSSPDHGSRFIITLPVSRSEEDRALADCRPSDV